MRILTELIDKAEDTLDEIFFYGTKALHLKSDMKQLADTFNKIAQMHVEIYGMLHTQMVNLINEKRKSGAEPPVSMIEVWNYEHERLIKEFSEAKTIVEEYNKSY
jgi:hypothetical protein